MTTEYEVGLEKSDGTFKHVAVEADGPDEAYRLAKKQNNSSYGPTEWSPYQAHNLDTGEEHHF